MSPIKTPFFDLTMELVRYGLVSVAALIVDFGCLLLLAHFFHYLLASCISFTLGGVMAYVLSVTFVFERRRVNSVPTELGAFIALGLVGLAVNTAVIAMAMNYWALTLALSKIMAAGATFTCNFALRKWLLFTRTNNNIEPSVARAG
jgi:putative flippase GtrA